MGRIDFISYAADAVERASELAAVDPPIAWADEHHFAFESECGRLDPAVSIAEKIRAITSTQLGRLLSADDAGGRRSELEREVQELRAANTDLVSRVARLEQQLSSGFAKLEEVLARSRADSAGADEHPTAAASPAVPYDRESADMARFAGQVIAYRDGDGVLGSAGSFEELYDRLDAAGLLDEHVVFDMIPGREEAPARPDEDVPA